MKVFYVMVLVLVAGAVPSHGRTESEGTVFNKTQLHESMSNVTESSSKLVVYSFLYLAMQWPRSFCNRENIFHRQCYQPVPSRFTVHGLWPQYDPKNEVECQHISPRYAPFDFHRLDHSLVPGLNQYWLGLTNRENNNQLFWYGEYNKHGSCISIQNLYFYNTLTMVASLGDLVLKLSLIRPVSNSGLPFFRPIIPGGTYQASEIKAAVHHVTNHLPTLRCILVEHKMQLLEIRFCVHRYNFQLIDCNFYPNFYSNCDNRVVYLPPA